MSARRVAKAAYRHVPFKLPMFRLLRRLPVNEGLYQHLHFDGTFDFALPDGTFLNWRSYGDIVENRLFWRGLDGHERISLQAWWKLAKAASGDAYDIGANSGLFACLAKSANPALAVTAFEPLARVARRLRHNVSLNGMDVRVVEMAVSHRPGTATMHDCDTPDSSGNAYSASLESSFAFNTFSYPVETIAIDQWRSGDVQPLSLVKLDVECHEPAAIAGMIETIRRDRPAILVEVLNDSIADAIGEQLSGLGYRYFQIDESAGLIEAERLAPLGGDNRNNLICTSDQLEAAGLNQLFAGARKGTTE